MDRLAIRDIDRRTSGLSRRGGRGPRKIVETITGDGDATAFTVNHFLETRDVQVEVYENDNNYETAACTIGRPSDIAVSITFSSAPSKGVEYRVVIVG